MVQAIPFPGYLGLTPFNIDVAGVRAWAGADRRVYLPRAAMTRVAVGPGRCPGRASRYSGVVSISPRRVYLLGLDHEKVTVLFSAECRLKDAHGWVARDSGLRGGRLLPSIDTAF